MNPRPHPMAQAGWAKPDRKRRLVGASGGSSGPSRPQEADPEVFLSPTRIRAGMC